MTVPYSYVAYIDEAGDPGLRRVKPRDNPGSSEWFNLGAVVIRAENEPKVVPWVRDILYKFSISNAPIFISRTSAPQRSGWYVRQWRRFLCDVSWFARTRRT